MKIGYTPGQMAALDDVRAERARLESRGLSRRTMLATCLGFAVGAGAGAVLADVTLPARPESERPVLGETPEGDDLRWAIGLAESGSVAELEQSFEVYWTQVLTHHGRYRQLWRGIERVGNAVLDGRLDITRRRETHLSKMIAGLIRTEESALLFPQHADLESRLRAKF